MEGTSLSGKQETTSPLHQKVVKKQVSGIKAAKGHMHPFPMIL